MEKKTYDLCIISGGRVTPMSSGRFEEVHKMVCGDKPFPNEDYVIIELPRCCYRLLKYNVNNQFIIKFLERTRKHQEECADA